jgi:hypothetical protein
MPPASGERAMVRREMGHVTPPPFPATLADEPQKNRRAAQSLVAIQAD